jgi:hypothetical protein
MVLSCRTKLLRTSNTELLRVSTDHAQALRISHGSSSVDDKMRARHTQLWITRIGLLHPYLNRSAGSESSPLSRSAKAFRKRE